MKIVWYYCIRGSRSNVHPSTFVGNQIKKRNNNGFEGFSQPRIDRTTLADVVRTTDRLNDQKNRRVSVAVTWMPLLKKIIIHIALKTQLKIDDSVFSHAILHCFQQYQYYYTSWSILSRKRWAYKLFNSAFLLVFFFLCFLRARSRYCEKLIVYLFIYFFSHSGL